MTQETSHENKILAELNRQENETKLEIEKVQNEIKLLSLQLGFTENLNPQETPSINSPDLNSDVALDDLSGPSILVQHSIKNNEDSISSQKVLDQENERSNTQKNETAQDSSEERQLRTQIPEHFVQNLSSMTSKETISLSIGGHMLIQIEHNESHQRIVLRFHPDQVEILFPNGTEFKLPLENCDILQVFEGAI